MVLGVDCEFAALQKHAGQTKAGFKMATSDFFVFTYAAGILLNDGETKKSIKALFYGAKSLLRALAHWDTQGL